MIKHTFFEKCNTIIENSDMNTGLNPVAELNVGDVLTRVLFRVNLDTLSKDVSEGVLNIKHLKHVLKMTNCGGVNIPSCEDDVMRKCGGKVRASSFDVIVFKLPFKWDEGHGFDYNGDFAKESFTKTSTDGSSWFKAMNGVEWDEHGVYLNDTLKYDYEYKYGVSEDSVIVGVQHFENGTENFEIDVTDYINSVLLGKSKNYGLGIAFAPDYEMTTTQNRYISFFTNHTNTFFLPYLETINEDVVLDCRAKFHLGIKNKLYFFTSDNGVFVNLDETPTCIIEGVEYEVKQSGKGIYYIEITLKADEFQPETILTDTWSNIVINGEKLDDVEMEFVVLPMTQKFSLGKHVSTASKCYPQLSGIHDKELLKTGEVREVLVDFIEEFSHGKKIIPNQAEYRVYVLENNREITVFPYHPIECYYDKHMFFINTDELIPNTYHIDIRVNCGREQRIFEDVLEFKMVDDITKIIH